MKMIEQGETILREQFKAEIPYMKAALRPEIESLIWKPGFIFAYQTSLLPSRLYTTPPKKEEPETAPAVAAWNELRDATNDIVSSMQNFKKTIEKMSKEFPKMIKEAQAGGK
jgi:hypothetical protein